MASYPGTNKTFAARSNGQVIDAAHVQDLQDEVAAMQDGLLNATARLNSSNSTVVNLSVSGNSTFAGTVTIAGTLVLPRRPCARVTHNAVQQIPNGGFTGLSWNTETHNSTAMHSTSVNSSRIALTSSGLWMIGAQVEWLGNATPSRYARIVVNDGGSTEVVAASVVPAGGNDPYVQNVSGPYLAASTTDYVTVQVLCNGSTGRVNAVTSDYGGCMFWANRVSN